MVACEAEAQIVEQRRLVQVVEARHVLDAILGQVVCEQQRVRRLRVRHSTLNGLKRHHAILGL